MHCPIDLANVHRFEHAHQVETVAEHCSAVTGYVHPAVEDQDGATTRSPEH